MSSFADTARLSPPEGVGALRRHRLEFTSLYFVCEGRPGGRDAEPIARAALAGGAGMIELRDRELPHDALLRAGETFSRLAADHSALFIVNDSPDLALELDADGVHVGQDDISPAAARAALGPDAIIGLSTHSVDQIRAAADEPVDYISVGPIWETPTKAGRPATGLELISTAAQIEERPWFAIGGIDQANLGQVVSAGASRACVVRAIRDAADPAAVAAAMRVALPRHAPAPAATGGLRG